ncbi:zonadhesin, partial [Biomphalaria pfeifferi]
AVTINITATPPRIYTLRDHEMTIEDGTKVKLNASELVDNTITPADSHGLINWKINKILNVMHVTITQYGLEMKLESDGTCMVTLRKDSILNGNLDGICGDNDGYINDELSLQNPIVAERTITKYKNDIIPCGQGLEKCKTPENEVAAQMSCKAINTVFYPCHSKVPPQDFLDYCYDAYCTSLQAAGEMEAHKAACNVISTYHTTCFLETGQAINWRSKTLC